MSFLSVRAKSEDQNKSVDDWSVGEWKGMVEGRKEGREGREGREGGKEGGTYCDRCDDSEWDKPG